MNSRKMKIIEALLAHLEDGDAEDMLAKLKPKAAAVEVTEVSAGGKGPMEKLMAKKGEVPEMDAPEAEGMQDEEEISDEDLEELIKERMS